MTSEICSATCKHFNGMPSNPCTCESLGVQDSLRPSHDVECFMIYQHCQLPKNHAPANSSMELEGCILHVITARAQDI